MRFVSLLFILIFLCTGPVESWGQESSLEKFLPVDQIDGWKVDGDADMFEGDDLFFLINGGADIYLEYGFNKVISRNYTNLKGNSLKVELYEMSDDGAAYGIYSLFTVEEGSEQFGQAGRIADNYLRFRTGRYLGMIMLQDKSPDALKAMIAFARFMLKDIPRGTEKPELISMLPDEGFIYAQVKYVRGHIGLSNIYSFNTSDIFGFSEGVYGYYGSHNLIILQFDDDEVIKQMFQKMPDKLMQNKKFTDLDFNGQSLRCRDNNEQFLVMEPFENYLLIYIGADIILQPELFERIREGDVVN